ncbi:MAG: DUF2887 domain-containing protein [Synechococcales cyanobacterium CRU_2_2]|nr:DUF2887 domain-containing protein [Synechococcales cyanobacterium CRU_2_2]
METDSLFYRLFQEKPKLIFELLGEKVPRTIYTFGSYEIKQTSLRADGVLQPNRRIARSSSLRPRATRPSRTSSTPASSPRSACFCTTMNHQTTGGQSFYSPNASTIPGCPITTASSTPAIGFNGSI